MRISRMLMPFACLAVAAALMFFTTPSPGVDYGAGYISASWHAPDLASAAVVYVFDEVAPVAESAVIRTPFDAHKAVFRIANQPLTAWRTAVDTAFPTDPHIDAA